MSSSAESPEAVALAGFPVGTTRVLVTAIAPDQHYAVVLLAIGAEAMLYQMVCERGPDGWIEASSGNGPGWTAVDHPLRTGLGVETMWAPAPSGTRSAVVEFEGEMHCVDVRGGYVLFAAWLVPDDMEPRARIVSFV